MLQRNTPISIPKFDKGLFTFSNFLQNEKGHSPNCMNIKWNFDDSIQKRLGAITTNTVQLGSTGIAGWALDASTSLTTSLKAWWKLDETSGTRNAQNITFPLSDINGTTYAGGIRGNAALFSAAASQGLTHINTATVAGSGHFSINSWFYINSTSTTKTRTVVGKYGVLDPKILFFCHFNGSDNSVGAQDLSQYDQDPDFNGGSIIDTAQAKFGTGALFLSGSNGTYVDVNGPAGFFDLNTEDFTIEMQARFLVKTTNMGLVDFSSQSGIDDASIGIWVDHGNNRLVVQNDTSTGAGNIRFPWTTNTATWYHIAVTRQSNVLRAFIDGTQIGTNGTLGSNLDSHTDPSIGSMLLPSDGKEFRGWIQEVRIIKGFAAYTSDFVAPASQYSGGNDYEYWLYVNTDNVLTFRVSSDGLTENATVRATSIGAINTSTWYNVVAWHSNGTHIGLSVNLSVNTALYTNSIKNGSGSFTVGCLSNGVNGFMDGRIDEVGFFNTTLNSDQRSTLYGGGSGNTYSLGASGFSWAMYDFGASLVRWVTVAAGTGIYASSNLGVTFVEVASSRTQNYQFFERSKNVLIACSDAYDQTLYWSGSANTFFANLAINSAPRAKFAQNHQGFLILMNSQDSNGTLSKRRFSYVDESLQLTSTWADFFDLPSTADDEITGSFILNRTLYVSTKYRIYRVSYVGGNPDWSYQVVAYWGYVPRTIQRASIEGGEVAIGLDWSRRIRIFDGVKDTIASDNIEDDNGMCEFATEKISYSGSGLVVSHSVVDPIEQEYRLNVAIGENSTQTTHAIILNLRSLAMYPYSNQEYQAMCMAESANRQYLMSADRSGRVYILNTGDLDIASPINEFYESPFIFSKVPGVVQKSNKIDLYFTKDSSGILYYQDRADFNSNWSNKPTRINLLNSQSNLHLVHSVDIPSTHNIYQFKLMSSSSTANPWRLTHADFFLQTMGVGKGQ